jgi:hypothetical protein
VGGAPHQPPPPPPPPPPPLRRQGHDLTLHVNRDAHNYVAWRDTLDPHLIQLLQRAWG